MRDIIIRASANPERKTSYAVFFRKTVDKSPAPVVIGSWTTENGSILELGRLVYNWIRYNTVPEEMERVNLNPEKVLVQGEFHD